MPKRLAASARKKESCVRKKKVEEVIVIDSESDDIIDGGDAPVICIESDDDDNTATVIVDSGHPSHQNDDAVVQKNPHDSDDNDELPSFESIMCTSVTGKKPKKEPEGRPAAEDVKKKPLGVLPPVDPLCTVIGPAFVYSNNKGFYNVMLTQTCLEKNMNKFYAMQLLVNSHDRSYYLWCRWGRVGEKGVFSLIPCGDNLIKAQVLFEKKFLQKTKNEWSKQHSFIKYSGKYDMLKMDYTGEDTDSENIEKQVVDLANNTVKSRLEPSVKDLMIFISDVKEVQKFVIDMKFDVVKMPLGKLTREQIREGYKALCKVEASINKSSSQKELMDACSEFYTCIPHSYPRSRRPEMIQTNEEVQMKMRLLEALEDIETALKLLKKDIQNYVHPLDNFYSSLGCDIRELDSSDSDLPLILQAVTNTQGETHNAYRLVVQNVFKVHKKSQEVSSLGNRRMLWHGSRASNFAGILSQGLRIAPPEVPSNGYMFGKGIYFADCVSKSANYCISERRTEEGLLLLCEVSLGNMEGFTSAQQNAPSLLPRGYHSVHGMGKYFPDPRRNLDMENGTVLACGRLILDPHMKSVLLYNEYIVYSNSQAKIDYLVRVKFDWS
ncbi:poly [ADP-ribose] polymerase 2-like [Amblyomma americanum]